MQRCQLCLVHRINLSVRINKCRHDLGVTARCRTVKRRPPVLVPAPYFSPRITQKYSGVHVTIKSGVVQWVVAQVVFVFNLNLVYFLMATFYGFVFESIITNSDYVANYAAYLVLLSDC